MQVTPPLPPSDPDDDAAHDAVAFHLAKLLDQHLLRDGRDRPLEVGKPHDVAAEQVEQDDQLPPALQQLQHVFNAFGGRLPRVVHGLTFR